MTALDDLHLIAELMAEHGMLVAAPAEGGNRALAAVDVGDAAMVEAGEILDGLCDALIVGGPYDIDIDIAGRDRAADDHHGKLTSQCPEALSRSLWA